jgi:putative ABC transport system ATP-binding protein
VELTGLSSAKRAEVRAESIGFVFQQFHLMPYLTAYENILAATVARTTDSGESRRKAASIAERFGLTDRLGHLPGELSTGERQRVALARACMNSPKIILADEPTGNLDGDNADIVLSFMRDFSEKGGSVFLVTHDKQAAQKADRTLFMKNGSICA